MNLTDQCPACGLVPPNHDLFRHVLRAEFPLQCRRPVERSGGLCECVLKEGHRGPCTPPTPEPVANPDDWTKDEEWDAK